MFGTGRRRWLRLWKGYQAVELPAAELARRASLLQVVPRPGGDRVSRTACANGRITIAAEYQEAVVFLEQAVLGAAELTPRIAAVDAAQAERLELLLEELSDHVTRLGPVPRVRELSAAGQAIVAATLGTSGTIDGDSVFTVIGQLLDSVDSAVRNAEWTWAERTRIQAYGLFDAGPELSLLALDRRWRRASTACSGRRAAQRGTGHRHRGAGRRFRSTCRCRQSAQRPAAGPGVLSRTPRRSRWP